MSTFSGNQLVVQSNKLVEAKYSLTVGEQRLILVLTSMINRNDTDFHEYELNVAELEQFLHLGKKSIYMKVEEIIHRLMTRVIRIDLPTGYMETHWISVAEYIKGEGVIKFSFHPKLRPYLLQLKEQFTRYSLSIATQFRSIYTIRLYALLKQYESIGYREILLHDLREILGIAETEYLQYKEFKRNVILRAKNEFEEIDKTTDKHKSDISFALEEFRKGRKVYKLRFNLEIRAREKTAKAEPILAITQEGVTSSAESNSLQQLLIEYGIEAKKAKHYIATKDKQLIEGAIKIYQQKLAAGSVNNLSGGYLIALLDADAGKLNPQEEREREQQEAANIQLQRHNELNQLRSEKQKLEQEHRKQQIDKILNIMSEVEREAVEQRFIAEKIVTNPLMVTKYKKKGMESPMIYAEFRKYIADIYL